MDGLVEEIEEIFSQRAVDEWEPHVHLRKTFTSLLSDSHPAADAFIRAAGLPARKQRKLARERIRLTDPIKRSKDQHRKRRSRTMKRIQQWATQAKLICIGRALDPLEWYENLTGGGSGRWADAFTDFAYFLRHKGVSIKQIASMLETTQERVNNALQTRL